MRYARRIKWVVAAGFFWLCVNTAPALALSFTIGGIIEDIDFSGAVADYGTTTADTLTVVLGANTLHLVGGGTVELNPNELTLVLELQAAGIGLFPVGNDVIGTMADLGGWDITMYDGPNLTAPNVIFEGEFTANAFGTGADVNIFGPGGSVGGEFDVNPLDNAFTDAIVALDGNLTIDLANIVPNPWNTVDSFTVSATADYTPGNTPNPANPEPGTGLLLGLGLAGLGFARRRTRRK